jgi:type IV pilus assembly protein PilW
MYTIDKWVRSAGSGFSQGAAYTFGCKLFAKNASGTVLPAPSTLPAPFDSINLGTAGEFRLAPILIAPHQTTPAVSGQPSDALIVMAGSAGYGETPVDLADVPAAATLPMTNIVSFNPSDILLVANRQGGAGTLQPCMIEQVSTTAPSAGNVPLAGAYAGATIGTASLTAMPLESSVVNLGNIANNNPPTFLMIGVGANNTLYTYDMLKSGTTPLLPVADGVFELHALYGVDTDNDGLVDSWVDPYTSTTYSTTALMAGTQSASVLLQSIKAIRVGLIMRTSLLEKPLAGVPVGPATVTLFSDIGGATPPTYTRTFTATERQYRYRTIETTIPVRNAMLL